MWDRTIKTSMLNKYFSSVFSSPIEADHITTNDTDTNDETDSVTVTN